MPYCSISKLNWEVQFLFQTFVRILNIDRQGKPTLLAVQHSTLTHSGVMCRTVNIVCSVRGTIYVALSELNIWNAHTNIASCTKTWDVAWTWLRSSRPLRPLRSLIWINFTTKGFYLEYTNIKALQRVMKM